MRVPYKRLFSPLLFLFFALTAWADQVDFDVKTNASYSGTHDVTLKGRTFTASEWTGLCLPFDASKAALDAAFGDGGYNLQAFDKMEGTTLHFKSVTAATAGKPYFIKVKTTNENPQFPSVTFAQDIDNSWKTVTIAENLVLRGFYFQKYAYELYDSNSSNEYLWLNADGTLSYKSEGTWVNERPGTSAYFFCPNTTSSATKPVIDFEGDDSGTGEGGDEDNTTLAYKLAHQLQITNLPTVYLTMADVSDIDKELYKNRSTNEAAYHKTAIKVLDKSGELAEFEEAADYLEVKVRGNSTASATKRPYRLKFAKKHKHDLLGRGYTKRNWTLLANAYDDSKVRNAITYKLGQLVGMPFCPGYKFVDLVINGDYRGLYQISDHCEVDADRVNVDEDTGWFVEAARDDMAEQPKVYGSGMAISIKNPEFDTDAQTDSIKEEVKTYFDQNNWSNKFSDFTDEGWRSVADEETLVKFYTAMQYTGDYDGFMVVKMYRNPGEKMKFGPLWDKDLAWGNYNNMANKMVEDTQTGYFATSTIKNDKAGVWSDPRFIKKVYDKMDALNKAGIATTLANYADSLSSLISESYTLDSIRWHGSWGKIDQMDGTLREDNRLKALENLKTYISTQASYVQTTVKTQYDALGCANLTDDTEERKQLTNLPTLYIDGNASGEWSRAAVEIFDTDKAIGGADTYTADDTKSGVQFQFQGTGKDGQKNGYRLKFDKKTQLLASGKFKQWVLLDNADDPTMARNALAFALGKAVGMDFAPQWQFVDVVLNGQYQGTYLLCDRVKAESGRALVSDGEKNQDWLVQLAAKGEVDEGDTYVATQGAMPNIIIKNPDPDDLTDDGIETLKTAVQDWFSNTFFTSVDGIRDHADQSQLIDWYIAEEVLGAYKGLSSVYAYRSTTASDQLLHFGPLWASEKAFGNNGSKHVLTMDDKGTDGSQEGLMTEFADHKLMRQMLKNLWLQDWFASGVLTRWQSLRGSSATTDLLATLKQTLADIKTATAQSAALNYKAATEGGAGWSLGDGVTLDAAFKAIETYLDERFAYLDAKFKQLAESRTLVFNTKKDDALEAWTLSNGQTVTVQLKNRGTLHGGEWNMLTLPFDLAATKATEVLGDGVQVKEFASVAVGDQTVSFYFSPVSQLQHAVPYIVQPTKDVSDLTFESVVLNTGAAETVEKGGFKLHGTLNATKLTAGRTTKYLDRNNEVKYLSADGTLYGCRAWIEAPASDAAKTVQLGFDETDGIGRVSADGNAPTAVYNLNGQCVGTASASLPHGVYIVGGKKMVK